MKSDELKGNEAIFHLKKRDYDSQTEVAFAQWLIELIQQGVIEAIMQTIPSFKLNDKLVQPFGKLDRTLIKERVYTPDFVIRLNEDSRHLVYALKKSKDKGLLPFVESEDGWIYIEIKGAFSRSYSATFGDRQAMVYNRYNIFINKVVPFNNKSPYKCLFSETFTPQAYQESMLYKVKAKEGMTKIKHPLKNIENFIKEIEYAQVK